MVVGICRFVFVLVVVLRIVVLVRRLHRLFVLELLIIALLFVIVAIVLLSYRRPLALLVFRVRLLRVMVSVVGGGRGISTSVRMYGPMDCFKHTISAAYVVPRLPIHICATILPSLSRAHLCMLCVLGVVCVWRFRAL